MKYTLRIIRTVEAWDVTYVAVEADTVEQARERYEELDPLSFEVEETNAGYAGPWELEQIEDEYGTTTWESWE